MGLAGIIKRLVAVVERLKRPRATPPQHDDAARSPLRQVFDELSTKQQEIFLREMRAMVEENEAKEKKGQ